MNFFHIVYIIVQDLIGHIQLLQSEADLVLLQRPEWNTL